MKRIGVFLGLTFILSWGAEFYLWSNGGLQNPLIQIFLTGLMIVPALSVLLTRWLTGEGFKDLWLRLDFKKNLRTYLIAWFGPPILIAAGTAIYFLLFQSNFDPELNMLRTSLQTAQETGAVEITAQVLFSTILMQIFISVIFAPLLNLIPSLGEELGWRGYLLPKLGELLGIPKAVLVSSVIWGVWHAPLIAMGYNYGKNYLGFPVIGILAMTIFCLFTGMFFSWLALQFQSAVPAAIAHGALNGFASIGVFFLKNGPNPLVGPYPTGIIGGIGFLIVGVICFNKIKAIPSEANTD